MNKFVSCLPADSYTVCGVLHVKLSFHISSRGFNSTTSADPLGLINLLRAKCPFSCQVEDFTTKLMHMHVADQALDRPHPPEFCYFSCVLNKFVSKETLINFAMIR